MIPRRINRDVLAQALSSPADSAPGSVAGFIVDERSGVRDYDDFLAVCFDIALAARSMGYQTIVIAPWGVDVFRDSKVSA